MNAAIPPWSANECGEWSCHIRYESAQRQSRPRRHIMCPSLLNASTVAGIPGSRSFHHTRPCLFSRTAGGRYGGLTMPPAEWLKRWPLRECYVVCALRRWTEPTETFVIERRSCRDRTQTSLRTLRISTKGLLIFITTRTRTLLTFRSARSSSLRSEQAACRRGPSHNRP
jgi:hypothetical protein